MKVRCTLNINILVEQFFFLENGNENVNNLFWIYYDIKYFNFRSFCWSISFTKIVINLYCISLMNGIDFSCYKEKHLINIFLSTHSAKYFKENLFYWNIIPEFHYFFQISNLTNFLSNDHKLKVIQKQAMRNPKRFK